MMTPLEGRVHRAARGAMAQNVSQADADSPIAHRTMEEAEKNGLNASHHRMLEATFGHVDKLLAEVERAATTQSPLARVLPDLTSIQVRVILDAVGRARQQLIESTRALIGRLPDPGARASWSIRTHLTMADIALEEVTSKRLRGYGQLDAAVSEQVERVVADLSRSIQRLQTYLAQGLGRDLAGRLERLEQTPVDMPLLRTLERIIAGRGLLEFRGTLESLLERLEAGNFEVAFFGRVSTGKSSLLNVILGEELLPVGVTPVTSVPTRISWGLDPQASISLAQLPDERIPVTELGQYVSEGGNPGNAKQVVRASVTLPVEVLRSGVVLVDTPGVGSLAHSGARETYAYLPRCDLGVVLVDAGSVPNEEDLELVRLLYESAVPAEVLLTKADLVSTSDLERLRTYLAGELKRRLRLEIPVHTVSALPSAQAFAGQWLEESFRPKVAQARNLAGESARRKLAHLHRAVEATLETLQRPSSVPPGQGTPSERIEELSHAIEGLLLAERNRLGMLVENLAIRIPAGWTEASRLWARGPGPGTPEALGRQAERALQRLGERCFEEVREGLRETRARLAAARDQLLREAGGLETGTELTTDFLSRPPLPFPTLPSSQEPLPKRWPRFPSWSERRAVVALGHWTRPAASVLSQYGLDLRHWALGQLERLASQAAADTEPIRARLRRARQERHPAHAEGLDADLAALRSHDSRIEPTRPLPQRDSATEGLKCP
jgi:GTP-binding protein EngB required for normal cell division